MPEHLLRGAGAVLLFMLGAVLARSSNGWETIAAIGCWAAAAVLLRGCPMCWAIGLVETLNDRRSGATAGKDCS